MKKGDVVITVDGPGVVRDIEEFRGCRRYGVELDKPKFEDLKIAYYFQNEVTKKEDGHNQS